MTPAEFRVKVYVTSDQEHWEDRGTGYVSWRAQHMVVTSEEDQSLILDTPISTNKDYKQDEGSDL